MYFDAVQQVTRSLEQFETLFEKAAAHGTARSFDAAVMLTARLAPDQYHFTRQVQAACDAAKFLAARTAGREPPKHPDTETDAHALRLRVQSVIAYLKTFKPDDFAGADGRVIPIAWAPGKALTARDYLWRLALPNFYFHFTTAYAILRHNGVDIGKSDYVGELPFLDL